mmetsp:Transcript_26735/g.62294  ORF Transcript_26735/g.62294 Transcript_26735/m.62294 type:complete len:115 (-) Transcript_26735:93-437(-)
MKMPSLDGTDVNAAAVDWMPRSTVNPAEGGVSAALASCSGSELRVYGQQQPGAIGDKLWSRVLAQTSKHVKGAVDIAWCPNGSKPAAPPTRTGGCSGPGCQSLAHRLEQPGSAG